MNDLTSFQPRAPLTIPLMGHPPHVGRLLEVVLANAGYRPVRCARSEDFLADAIAGRVGLVVAADGFDDAMGSTMAAEFWADPRLRDLPILLINARLDERAMPRTPNVRRVLSTPFSPRSVVADVARWLAVEPHNRPAEAA